MCISVARLERERERERERENRDGVCSKYNQHKIDGL